MSIKRLKMELYRKLWSQRDEILAECAKIPAQIGFPSELKGKIGLSPQMSGRPGELRKNVREAVNRVSDETVLLKYLAEELRTVVKEGYGDEYDAVLTNTCEAALWLAADILFSPPMGKGDAYQACYIAPYERHLHHQGSYGRPFPPKYKDIFADRGVAAGELGFLGKRQSNLSTLIVPLEGAKYDCHGVKYYPTPLLTKVDAEASYKKIAEVADRHCASLTGITSLGYDTPGYGYGDKDADGVPKLLRLLAKLGNKYNIPYLADNAGGVPFIGTDIRQIGADIIVYSTDKGIGAPIGGLVIGKEEIMVPFRRAMGMHSARNGSLAYGKGAYVTVDPGKFSLAGTIAALKTFREKPEIVTNAIDAMHQIVLEEMKDLDPEISQYLIVTKSYNYIGVEINYENSWSEDRIGFPIFSIEDMYAGTNLFLDAVEAAGIEAEGYDGNIPLSPGLGTLDENGQLIDEYMRYCVRILFKAMEVMARFWNH